MKPCANRMLLLILIAAAPCVPACAQKTAPLDAQGLIADIDAKGAKTVVANLERTKGWDAVFHRIQTGAPAWLDVAKKLRPGTDAGSTEGLDISLAIALTHNATGVLSMVGPDLDIKTVCSVPYIEPDEKTVRAHRMKVRAALSKVASPKLAALKKDCLDTNNK